MNKLITAILAAAISITALADVTYTDLTTGAMRRAKVDVDSRLNVVTDHPTRFSASLINSSATTLTQIQAAPGAALSLYITDIQMSASAAATVTADQYLVLKYGTGANCGTGTAVIFACYNAALGGCTANLTTPIKIPANNALCFMDAVAGSKSVTVNGYTAP